MDLIIGLFWRISQAENTVKGRERERMRKEKQCECSDPDSPLSSRPSVAQPSLDCTECWAVVSLAAGWLQGWLARRSCSWVCTY